MAKIIIIFFLLSTELMFSQDDALVNKKAGAQVNDTIKNSDERWKLVAKSMEVQFSLRGFNPPEQAPAGTYKVYVTFTINKDGTFSNVKVKDPGYGIGEEVKRAFLELPKTDPDLVNKMVEKLGGSAFTIPLKVSIGE